MTRDSSGRGPPSGADRRDPGWSLSETDRQRTVRETARFSPTEIGCVGWFNTRAGQFSLTCLLPLPADVNEKIESNSLSAMNFM